MANEEHLKLLKQGVEAWNKWRKENPTIQPDLRKVDLSGADLSGADLSEAHLSEADFISFIRAELREAHLSEADLIRAELRKTQLHMTDLIGAEIDLVDRIRANLRTADRRRALLNRADLRKADLSGAHLSGADLSGANLVGADLQGANVEGAVLGSTVLCDVDLSVVRGLELVQHRGPSTIGIDTIYKSKGKIPEVFLRGCGVPDTMIAYIASLVGQPIQYYSCFISYSHNDEEFAKRLYSRLRDEHIRVWFAPEDIKGGEKLYEQIDRAIQVHDRLLLVLSENSLRSEWVMTEIRRARKTEIKEKRRKLFPIRLVDFETIRQWECFDADTGKDLAVEVREYFIPDFSNWKDQDAFEAAFDRLLRDLKAESQEP